jgi:replicative DNA helicase
MTAVKTQNGKSKPRRNDAPARRPLTELMDRQPPFDLQAEIGVLGSIILLPTLLDDVATIIRADDFYDDANRKLFKNLAAMHAADKRIDDTLLVNHLKAAGDFEAIGGSAYIAKVTNAVPNAAHVVYYAEIVREKSELRQAILAYTIGLQQAYDGLPVQDISATVEGKLAVFGHRSGSPIFTIGEAAEAALAEIDTAMESSRATGMGTGLPNLDEAAGLMRPGQVIVVGARPGKGKTAFGMNIACHAASQGHPSLVVSLEMLCTELAVRKLCEFSGLDSRDVLAGRVGSENRRKLLDASHALTDLPVRIWSPSSATLSDIRAVARLNKARHGVELLVIDYLSLVEPHPDDRRIDRRLQVARISRDIKRLAKELMMPIVLLHQVNRQADTAEQPHLSHLAESSAVEADADRVYFLHHQPMPPNVPDDAAARLAHLVIAKNRGGQTGKVNLLWHPRETRFSCPSDF